ncbi:MAG: 4-phosphoerythronate dehydrogenase, partial [Verrucomicrobiia bacterium]
MKIIADPNIPFVREAFAPLGDVQFIPGRQITAAAVRDAELLLIRSITPVNAALLDGSRVKFVATATIGTDHVAMADLAKHGIGFASAAGSNANSVAEYIVAAMLELAHRRGFRLHGRTLGVIGIGNVGSRVVRYAEALGMRVLQNDPPRERAENLSYLVPLNRVLAESDIVTIHVPLTKSGLDTTFHMFDANRLAGLEKRRPILINSARGAVVDNKALLETIAAKKLGGVVLDVWEGEPNINTDLLAAVSPDTDVGSRDCGIGTPHIAGYSFDGKLNGTRMIYKAVCGFFGVKPTWQPVLPPPPVPQLEVTVGAGEDAEDVLRRVIGQIYDITADDAALRKIISAPDGVGASPDMIGVNFDKLRNEYGIRREFFNTKLTLR